MACYVPEVPRLLVQRSATPQDASRLTFSRLGAQRLLASASESIVLSLVPTIRGTPWQGRCAFENSLGTSRLRAGIVTFQRPPPGQDQAIGGDHCRADRQR